MIPAGLPTRLGIQGLLTPAFGALFVPSVASSGTLQITSGNVTLWNRGTTAVTVTDGTNPVTGCTLVISDGSKATATAQNVYGIAQSGTYTVKATKVGYTDSATVTFTAAGGLVLDLDPYLGTNTTTNGANVTSWTDQSSTAAVFGELVNPPTYLSSGLNGSPAIVGNGTNQLLSTATTIAALNPARWTLSIGFQSSSDGGGTNRSLLGNLVANTGYNYLLTTTNQARFTVGTGTTTAALSSAANTALAATGHYGLCTYDDGGSSQASWLDATQVPSSPQSTGITPNITTVVRLFTNNTGTGNFYPGAIYRILLHNLVANSTQQAQLDLTQKLRMGL